MVGAYVPISVLLVWISNPVTITPIFYLCYKVGQLIIHTPNATLAGATSSEHFLQLGQLWQPFLLGCFIMGSASAIIAYTTVKVLWRLHIIAYLKERRARKKALN